MSSTGTVQQFGQSSNGKPKVQVDGQWFFLGKSDMSTVQVGDRISYESRSSNFNGRDLWFIDKYAKLPSTTNGVHAAPAQAPVRTPPTTTASGMSEGERLCVSNWIGQGIGHGTITSPDELDIWVKAALAAIRGGRVPGEDDV